MGPTAELDLTPRVGTLPDGRTRFALTAHDLGVLAQRTANLAPFHPSHQTWLKELTDGRGVAIAESAWRVTFGHGWASRDFITSAAEAVVRGWRDLLTATIRRENPLVDADELVRMMDWPSFLSAVARLREVAGTLPVREDLAGAIERFLELDRIFFLTEPAPARPALSLVSDSGPAAAAT